VSSKPVLSLADVPGLAGLAEVADRFGVDITAHGSVLRHLVSRASGGSIRSTVGDYFVATPEAGLQLFDLTPYAADIDLIHSGPDSLTDRLYDEILNTVPSAECFRWQLISATENASRVQALRCSAIIPANLMTLSTGSTQGIYDPWTGVEDIVTPKYRFIRNGFFVDSPLYRSLRDLEVFSALHYFRILLAEFHDIHDIEAQPGFDDAREVVKDATTIPDTLLRLQKSDYLRARLVYLFQSLCAAARSSRTLRLVLVRSHLRAFVAMIRRQLPGVLGARLVGLLATVRTPGEAIVSSNWLGGDHFRCEGRTTFTRDVQSALAGGPPTGPRTEPVGVTLPSVIELLAEHHEAILCSAPVAITAGQSASAAGPVPQVAGSRPQLVPRRRDEFVHIAVRMHRSSTADRIACLNPENITAVMLLSGTPSLPDGRVVTLPLPVVAQFVPRDEQCPRWLYLRINSFGCLEDIVETTATTQNRADRPVNDGLVARILVIAWSYREDDTSPPTAG
jgi:hypothetical protein